MPSGVMVRELVFIKASSFLHLLAAHRRDHSTRRKQEESAAEECQEERNVLGKALSSKGPWLATTVSSRNKLMAS